MGSQEEPLSVLITGFGPFCGHDINASWESVKELSRTGVAPNIRIHAKEIPVDYKYVIEEIPKMCKELKPNVIIHVGVSGITEVVQIESCAHKKGYDRKDVNGYAPDEHSETQECLKTSIDINKLRRYCQKNHCFCEVDSSENAGRYLCEFIYYTSLSFHVAPTLFVHVPCLNSPYSKENLADALRLIIRGALEQIEKR